MRWGYQGEIGVRGYAAYRDPEVLRMAELAHELNATAMSPLTNSANVTGTANEQPEYGVLWEAYAVDPASSGAITYPSAAGTVGWVPGAALAFNTAGVGTNPPAGTGLATSPPAYSTTAPFGDDYGSVTTPYTVQYVDPAPTSTTTYNAGVLLGVNTLGAAAPAVPNAALGTGASPRLPFWVAMTGKRGIMQVLVDNTTTIGHTLLVSTSHIGNYSDSGGATRTYGTHVGIALQAVTVSTGPILCWAYINMP